MTGHERLREWIMRSKATQREAAKILGLDHTFLNQILKERRTPGLANALKIERIAGIAVESWAPTDDGESERAVTVRARRGR